MTEGSIAHQAGLEYGDQLLEVRAAHCRQVTNVTPFFSTRQRRTQIYGGVPKDAPVLSFHLLQAFSSITVTAAACAVTAVVLLILLLLQQLLQPEMRVTRVQVTSRFQVLTFKSKASPNLLW